MNKKNNKKPTKKKLDFIPDNILTLPDSKEKSTSKEASSFLDWKAILNPDF